jgi:hypothetical protein
MHKIGSPGGPASPIILIIACLYAVKCVPRPGGNQFEGLVIFIAAHTPKHRVWRIELLSILALFRDALVGPLAAIVEIRARNQAHVERQIVCIGKQQDTPPSYQR